MNQENQIEQLTNSIEELSNEVNELKQLLKCGFTNWNIAEALSSIANALFEANQKK
jgi:DNA-binding NarL/FixJ family response regulator